MKYKIIIYVSLICNISLCICIYHNNNIICLGFRTQDDGE